MNCVTNLWRHRTVPRLEIMAEVYEGLRMVIPDQAPDFLERANEMLEEVKRAMGPLEIWCGDRALGEEALTVITLQLNDPSKGISPHTSKRCLTSPRTRAASAATESA